MIDLAAVGGIGGLQRPTDLLADDGGVVGMHEALGVAGRGHGVAAFGLGGGAQQSIELIVEGESVAGDIIFPVGQLRDAQRFGQLGLIAARCLFGLLARGDVAVHGHKAHRRIIVVDDGYVGALHRHQPTVFGLVDDFAGHHLTTQQRSPELGIALWRDQARLEDARRLAHRFGGPVAINLFKGWIGVHDLAIQIGHEHGVG